MAELSNNPTRIDMEDRHLVVVRAILKKYLSGKEVWAYGSRVKGNATERSDLDCAVFDATEIEIDEAREAFTESEIPFEVQLFGWQSLPPTFQENIAKHYVVLQCRKPPSL